jgi:(2Fe-2S) ferredoxin
MSHKIEKGLEKAGFYGAKRHLFFCLGPDCCNYREGEGLWDYVKHRLKQIEIPVMRTKVGCFRICTQGPWLTVYPEGIWYPKVTPERFDRILKEHLIGGKPVEEWVAGHNDLCGHHDDHPAHNH